MFSGIQCRILKDQKNHLRQNAILLRSKWRKETEGGWRMYVDITFEDKFDEENDADDVIMSENEDEITS